VIRRNKNVIVRTSSVICQEDPRDVSCAPGGRRPAVPMLVLGALLFVLSYTDPLGAEIYRFVDEKGVAHFTNIPVDSRYKLFLHDSKPSRHFGSSKTPTCYDPIIKEVCNRYVVDYHLVRAVIKVESDFDPAAVSNKGAKGLMQLMPETAQDMEVGNVFNPRQNIEGGVKYLRRLLDMFNHNLTLSLAAYNAGENAVKQYNLQIPPYQETQDYVKKVLHHFEKFKRGGPF